MYKAPMKCFSELRHTSQIIGKYGQIVMKTNTYKPASYFSFILLVAEIADKVLPSTCAEFSVTDEGN